MDTALMRQFSWLAVGAGLFTTVIVLIASILGLFRDLELSTADWRYTHVRRQPVALSSDIALVALDDSALDTYGRWPWPRERFAEVIDELRYLGAKTLALDIQFTEPEVGCHGEGGDGDRKLGEALQSPHVNSVIGLDAGQQWPERERALWLTPEGAEKQTEIIELLTNDLSAEPADVAAKVSLSESLAADLKRHYTWFKSLAIWQYIWSSYSKSQELPQAIDVRKAMNVKGASAGEFLVDRMLRQATVWLELRQEIQREGEWTFPIGGHAQIPPILELGKAACAVGVLTNVQCPLDTDGDKRRTLVEWSAPGGNVFQMGLVAAAVHLGWKPTDIASEPDQIRVGQVTLPMRDGWLYLDWPTSTFDQGYGEWTQHGMQGSERPVLSIGMLLNTRENRQILERNRERLKELRESLVHSPDGVEYGWATHEDAAKLCAAVEKDVAFLDDPTDARTFIETFRNVQESEPKFRMLEEELRGKVAKRLVFVGWTATGVAADFVPTALHPKTPGVFVHVVAADMVLGKHGRQTAAAWVDPIVLVTLGIAATLIAATLSVGFSSLLTLVLAVGWLLVAGVFCFNELNVIMPLVAPTVSPVGSWATTTAVVAVLTARDRARINRQFAARVSPQLVAKLSGDPEAVSMSGEEREITVMFGDLAGFTSIAEALGGPGVVRTLNTYLGTLSEELVGRNAYVNKFLGDGFMAFWSAFGDEPRQESMAAESAVACQKAVAELGKGAEDGSPKISLRLGIATGEAVVGDCGAPPKLNDYTAIGDCVNLSARLESANKQFGTAILMDGPTHRGFMSQGGNPHVRTRALGAIVVVGQSKPVEIFEACPADADGDWIAATESAVGLFRDKRTADAEQAWRAFESKYGASKLSAMYLAAIADVRSGEAPEDGVLHLRAK